MADIFTSKKRSEVMSAIRGKGNRNTELKTVSLFKKHGIVGWRRHSARLPGRPDFAFHSSRLAIFIDGCFWHGCIKCYVQPKSNVRYWKQKIARNQERDRTVNRLLRSSGWKVVRVWEHEIKKQSHDLPRRLLNRI